jgi:hypothetical protein
MDNALQSCCGGLDDRNGLGALLRVEAALLGYWMWFRECITGTQKGWMVTEEGMGLRMRWDG